MATLEQLRSVPLLSDCSDRQLQWLLDHSIERFFEPGEFTVHRDDPADRMIILLEGEIEVRAEYDRVAYQARKGDITGKLPHSRMTVYPRDVHAVGHVQLLEIAETDFGEMLERIPRLEARLVGVMVDRTREFTSAEIQQSKLAALGKLSAGLAHELNNPAAAAARAAAQLRENLVQIRDLDCTIAQQELTSEQRAAIVTAEQKAVDRCRSQKPTDALTRSDREEELGAILQKAGVEDAWELAPQLVDAGFDRESLDAFAAQTGAAFRPALARTAVLMATDRLAEEIQESMVRISSLVKSMKDYSYMDTAGEREVDIHKDIENTLRLLDGKIRKAGVVVDREYGPDVPAICANGSELNQVWTNLIDNAIDALSEPGVAEKLLRIRTARRLDRVTVEFTDSGPGISPERQRRVFDPFYTTKKQGEGTGLGLDIVQRIIRRHRGDLRLESEPGRTSFQVDLPVQRK